MDGQPKNDRFSPPPPPCNLLISDHHGCGGKFPPSSFRGKDLALSRFGGGSVVATFILAISPFGFGGGAQADNRIQVSGCAGTEGTHYFATDNQVYCSSSATDTDISIDLEDATILLPENYAGWSGVWGYHTGTGNINIKAEGGSVTTSTPNAHGVYGLHFGTGNLGNIDINVQDSAIMTSGANAYGIFGRHNGTGDINIKAEGGSVTTSGAAARAVYGWHEGIGNIDILVKDSVLTTSGVTPLGDGSRAVLGQHQGSGNLDIDVQDSTITASGLGIQANKLGTGTGNVNIKVKGSAITSSAGAILGRRFSGGDGDISVVVRDSIVTASGQYGILGQSDGTGGINIQVQGGLINAPGLNAHGIQVQIASATGFDAEGYRRQSVTVDGTVRGGSGLGAGVRLAGGGRVVVGPNGHIGATSGIAIWATGTGALHLDFRPDGRTMWEVASGTLVSDDPITMVVNGVVLIDGAAGSTGWWAPNGAWEVRGRMVRVGRYITANTTEVYAPRAALYESLPGLLLQLDAGAPVRRPEEPVWARLEYGTGSGDPKRSQVGASYDFDRMDAMAGVSRDWGNGWGGSTWLRRVHGEIKADMPTGPGEMELHGVGVGVAAHWRRGDGLEVSGELSLTDFDVDANSSWHGHLAEDAGADLWQARLAAEYRLEQAEGLALFPRVWAWHAKAEVDGFTDAVGARVSADESRTAIGLGLRAEVEQSESLLYGTLDVEHLVGGTETVTAVSQGRLASESERTRVLVGAGGLWQGQRVTLQGGLRMADPGGKNQEVSASFSIGGSF